MVEKRDNSTTRSQSYSITYRYAAKESGEFVTYEEETNVSSDIYNVLLAGSKIAVVYAVDEPMIVRLKSQFVVMRAEVANHPYLLIGILVLSGLFLRSFSIWYGSVRRKRN